MGLSPREARAWRAFRQALPAFAIVGLSLALWAGGDALREAFSFDRSGIAAGEVWRLLTGHLVHLGTSHLVLNAAGVVLVWLLVGRAYSIREWAILSLAVIVAIDAGLWWLNPRLDWYVGLSGVLHGWLAAGSVNLLYRGRSDGWLLLGLLAAKLVFEQWQGLIPGSVESAGGPVIVDAHLYGGLAGAASGFVLTRLGARSGL